MAQTTDGRLIVAGNTASFGNGNTNAYIVKLDQSGNTCNSINPVSLTGSGGILTNVTPTITSPNPTVTSPAPLTGTGGLTTNICITNVQKKSNKIPESFMLYQNYPNPFNPSTKIKFDIRPPLTPLLSKEGTGLLDGQAWVFLKIYDLFGQEIAALINQKLQPGSYEVQWNATNFPSGVYFYQLKIINNKSEIDWKETKRMVLVK